MAPLKYFASRPELSLPAEWLEWLAAALGGAPLANPPADLPEWRTALGRHGILPLLYERLRDDPLWPSLTVEMATALSGAFQSNAARTALLQRELERISDAFPWLGLLKGAAVGITVYANPALRPVSDLDLLVRREDAGAAAQRLADLGYSGVGAVASPTFGEFARRFRCQLPLVASVPGLPRLLVELHWSLVEIPFYVNLIDPAEIWADADERTARPYVIPRPAVLLAHAAAHLAMHHSRDLRLIWLVDVDRLARSSALDWDDLVRLASAWKLGLALYAVLADAGTWLGTAAPRPAMAALARLSADKMAKKAWGLADDVDGRAWRRAAATIGALPPVPALKYAGWLAARAALRPVEWWMMARHGRMQ
jgi:hypothetical protein